MHPDFPLRNTAVLWVAVASLFSFLNSSIQRNKNKTPIVVPSRSLLEKNVTFPSGKNVANFFRLQYNRKVF